MIAAGGDIEHRVEIGSLAGAGEHSGRAALHGSDLGRHHIAGGILQPGIKIALRFQIKELAHILRGGILEGGTLNDGDLPGLTAFGAVARLDAQGLHMKVLFHKRSPQTNDFCLYCTPNRTFCQSAQTQNSGAPRHRCTLIQIYSTVTSPKLTLVFSWMTP